MNFKNMVGTLLSFDKIIVQLKLFFLTLRVKVNYNKTLKNLIKVAKKRKIKVIFFVSERSKWKCQTLYDLMAKSDSFEPLIALDLPRGYLYGPAYEPDYYLARNKEYFESRKMPYVVALSTLEKKYDLRQLSPDIIFYQQPWNLSVETDPFEASTYALSCYVPYFVAGFGAPKIECKQLLHRLVWRHFILNDTFVKFYEQYVPAYLNAGKMLGLGHPILDAYYLAKDKIEKKGFVIYAPHWSFDHPLNQEGNELKLSTFLENGKFILNYAQSHPEINWVFKPHPTLRRSLLKCGIMTKEELEQYWDAWRKIGMVHDTPDYQELFMASKAMITDSSSFTVEYPATGNPLIYLVSKVSKESLNGPDKELRNIFYRCKDLEELKDALTLVIEKNLDPMYEQRINVVKKMGLTSTYAALNILNHIKAELKIKD